MMTMMMMGIFFYMFPPRLVRYTEVEFANKTSASNLDQKNICYSAISDKTFLPIFIFFRLTLMDPVEIFFKMDC